MRAAELLLGIAVPGVPALQSLNPSTVSDLSGQIANACADDKSGLFESGSAVVTALTEAILILVEMEQELGSLDLGTGKGRSPLTAKLVFPLPFS